MSMVGPKEYQAANAETAETAGVDAGVNWTGGIGLRKLDFLVGTD